MNTENFIAHYDKTNGLTITWDAGNNVRLTQLPVRVSIKGSDVFRVWSQVDSGEGPPVWAEPDTNPTFFGGSEQSPETRHEIEHITAEGVSGYRITATHDRAEVVLDMVVRQGELEASLSVSNPQQLGGKAFPLCSLDFSIGNLTLGPNAEYASAHAYGGRTHGWGKLAELEADGVPFIHGCIGLALPVVCLHQPETNTGLQLEFMMDGRPTAWLRPTEKPDVVSWSMKWSTDRRLEPGETHTYGGKLRLKSFNARPVEMIRAWRDDAEPRYGLKPVPAPDWARYGNIIEFNTDPANTLMPFERLDDPRVYEMLKSWKEIGYTTIFTVGHNNTGTHFLSPYNYEPSEEAGGFEGEKQYLDWAHELGFTAFLWVTTVGMERRAPEVREHPDWWTHRPDGSLFYAWDSNPETRYVGYAPDADPMSKGWRDWLKNEVRKLIERGFDGIFIDGCIPRASNHARWDWPGKGRDSVPDQVREMADFLRALRPDLALIVEDDGLYAQVTCEVTQGRYYPIPPYFKKAHWDHGMGGGPEAAVAAPKRIPPEMARDYLLLRYASRLPGVVTKEGHEGYYSEDTRPWGVQMLTAGSVPKTHSQYVDYAEEFRPIHDAEEVLEQDKLPEQRRRGHEEFVELLKLVRDERLFRDAPVSIEGVKIEGAAAVVPILRPSKNRAFLTLIQFAGRSATVRFSLTEPVDVPRAQRDFAGEPQSGTWKAREIMRSMVEAEKTPDFELSGESPATVELGPYSFRVFELSR